MSHRIGLNCALSTPFDAKGAVDLPRLTAHAKWVLDNGCTGITAFGTTGEGASLALLERAQVLSALATVGLNLRQQTVVGVSAASIDDAVSQARLGYEMDCRALLFAPPFYFGDASDEGLYRYFATVFEKLGGQLRDVILYHIPGMTRNSISIELTQRLAKAFPNLVIGVKDSAGDWNMTERRLNELPDLQILVGDERQLAKAVQKGGSGTICGLANIAPDLLKPLAEAGIEDARVNAMVAAIVSRSFMSAVKALISDRLGDEAWLTMRAPLTGLSASNARALASEIDAIRGLANSNASLGMAVAS